MVEKYPQTIQYGNLKTDWTQCKIEIYYIVF